jgi:DNA replication protein DnaC
LVRPSFQIYRTNDTLTFATDAAQANQTYEQFLLALAEQELAQRERHREARLIRAARFPVLKELADFDFTSVPDLNKALVLELAQGHYLRTAEPVLLVGNPGLGKTQPEHYPHRDKCSPN